MKKVWCFMKKGTKLEMMALSEEIEMTVENLFRRVYQSVQAAKQNTTC